MIGSFLTRGLVMVFGYAFPAYECYKTVEKNKPEIEDLRFWCQYWILVAALTVSERIGDTFISWVPMYSEAKLAFFIYLWYPKTKGTTFVYESFFKPYVAKHENEIDRNLLELRARAGDVAVSYWRRAATYGQTRVFEILHYIALRSTVRPQQGTRAHQAPNHKPTSEESPSPTSSVSSSQHQVEAASEVLGPPQKVPSSVAVAKPLNSQKAAASSEIKDQSSVNKAGTKHIEVVATSTNDSKQSSSKEIIMDESVRITRGRMRKARARATQQ